MHYERPGGSRESVRDADRACETRPYGGEGNGDSDSKGNGKSDSKSNGKFKSNSISLVG
jgi:hypothetical protein